MAAWSHGHHQMLFLLYRDAPTGLYCSHLQLMFVCGSIHIQFCMGWDQVTVFALRNSWVASYTFLWVIIHFHCQLSAQFCSICLNRSREYRPVHISSCCFYQQAAHTITLPAPWLTDDTACFGSQYISLVLKTFLLPSFSYNSILDSSVQRISLRTVQTLLQIFWQTNLTSLMRKQILANTICNAVHSPFKTQKACAPYWNCSFSPHDK